MSLALPATTGDLTPVVNYGWEINVMNHLRLMTAYEDLDTARLVAEVR